MSFLFFIIDKEYNSRWGVTKIDTSCKNRLGWLNCECIEIGSDPDIYKGTERGIDASYVFNNPKLFDVTKMHV